MAKKAIKRRIKKTRSTVKRGIRHHLVTKHDKELVAKQNAEQARQELLHQQQQQQSLSQQMQAGNTSLRTQLLMRAGLGLPIGLGGSSQPNVKFEKMKQRTEQIAADNAASKAQMEALRADREAQIRQKNELKKKKREMKEELHKKEMENNRLQMELDMKAKHDAEMERLAQQNYELQRQQMELQGNSAIQQQIAQNKNAESLNKQLAYNLAHAKKEVELNEAYNEYQSLNKQNDDLNQELQAIKKVQQSKDYENAVNMKVEAMYKKQRLEREIEAAKAELEMKEKQIELDTYKRETGDKGYSQAIQEQLVAKLNLEETSHRLNEEKDRYKRMVDTFQKNKDELTNKEIENAALDAYTKSLKSVDSIRNDIKAQAEEIARMEAKAKQLKRLIELLEKKNLSEDEWMKAMTEANYFNSDVYNELRAKETKIKQEGHQAELAAKDTNTVNETYRSTQDSKMKKDLASAEGEYMESKDSQDMNEKILKNKKDTKKNEMLTEKTKEVNDAKKEEQHSEMDKDLAEFENELTTSDEAIRTNVELLRLKKNAALNQQKKEDAERRMEAQEQRIKSAAAVNITQALANDGHYSACKQNEELIQLNVSIDEFEKRLVANVETFSNIEELVGYNTGFYDRFVNEECDGKNPIPNADPKVCDPKFVYSVFRRFNEFVKNNGGQYYQF